MSHSSEETRSDLSARLRVKAARLRESAGLIYDVKWREVFITTAVLFEEAAAEIDQLHSDLVWSDILHDDTKAQLKRLQQEVAEKPH